MANSLNPKPGPQAKSQLNKIPFRWGKKVRPDDPEAKAFLQGPSTVYLNYGKPFGFSGNLSVASGAYILLVPV